MEEPEVKFVAVKVDKDGNVIEEANAEEVKEAFGGRISSSIEKDIVHPKKKEEPRIMTPKEKNVKPIANTKAVKKKSHWKKFKEALFGEDVTNVPEFILYDMLIPACKKLFVDIVNGALGMALFGDGNIRRRGDNNRTHVSMSSVYEGRNGVSGSGRIAKNRSKVNDIVFDSQNDAEMVLDQLIDLVDQYGMASLQDLYFMVGMDAAHTDANYGWTNLRGATMIAASDGYVLDLPPVKALV